MSNLLNKPGNSSTKVNKIDRIETTAPQNTFSPNDVFTISQDTEMPLPQKKQDKKQQDKSTSIRCSFRNKDRLNALVVLNGSDSVDQILDIILDEHEATMTQEQRRELRTIINIYSKKR